MKPESIPFEFLFPELRVTGPKGDLWNLALLQLNDDELEDWFQVGQHSCKVGPLFLSGSVALRSVELKIGSNSLNVAILISGFMERIKGASLSPTKIAGSPFAFLPPFEGRMRGCHLRNAGMPKRTQDGAFGGKPIWHANKAERFVA